MGLDIQAWGKATPTDHVTELDDGVPRHWCENEDHVIAFVYRGFEPSLDGLEAGRCYEIGGERFSFRAGSYSGYGEWRRDLAKSVRLDIDLVWASQEECRDRPFFELLNFADNEGTIGPDAAKRLAADFAEYRDAYRAAHASEPWFREKYDDWQHAFDIAAGGGLVRFL